MLKILRVLITVKMMTKDLHVISKLKCYYVFVYTEIEINENFMMNL